MIFLLPSDRLPMDVAARDARLCDYFCERFATSRRDGDMWMVEVAPLPTAEFYVDPRLPDGLQWWDPDLTITGIPYAHRDEQGMVLSLNDAWTAYAWSEAWRAAGGVPEHVIVLHVDDHDDLMTPRLTMGADGVFVDLLTGARVDFADPATVSAAVRSGAIAQGSFLAPLLHTTTVEVRHLCQNRYVDSRRGAYGLAPTVEPDTLLDPGSSRPAATLTEFGCGPSIYRFASTVDEWLEDIPDGEVVLHVDFDYFNNRYDGDSDWTMRPTLFDPPLDEVIGHIREVVQSVGTLDRPMAAVSAALSPGFFPAEMWPEATNALIEAARPMLLER